MYSSFSDRRSRLGKRSAAHSPEPTKRRCLPHHAGKRDWDAPTRSAAEGRYNAPPREIGFRRLESLAKDDGLTILSKLSDESTLALFGKLTCKEEMREDWMRLVVTILAKVCRVEYKPILTRVVHKICHKQFIDQLLLHISRLSCQNNTDKLAELGVFFDELCTFCEALQTLLPHMACNNLGIILKAASRELEDMPPFEGSEDICKKVNVLREKFKKEAEVLESLKAASKAETSLTTKPPSDFRELSHFPTIEDIVVESRARPFLRPSKVDPKVHGAYENVDDYLDTQFRLMREDFVRPLREGISNLRQARAAGHNLDKKASRIQNIRVYENVEIQDFTREHFGNVGIVLNFDPRKRFASHIRWEYSKRLMNGSLLVLSVDEQFSHIVIVTVTKRNIRELQNGRVVVELCEGSVTEDLLRHQYLMIECQVFFGIYSHVLKALKSFNENSFPLAEYIVHASNVKQLPGYLERALAANKRFLLPGKCDKEESLDEDADTDIDKKNQRRKNLRLETSDDDDMSDISKEEHVSVDVKNFDTWPSARSMGLDDSQHQALCGALTNKVMLIQGPPGTGKTFLGLKIAACLFKNKELWRPSLDRRPMLVVCYTNHALDQFLVGLKEKEVTDSIVRVGGGCKEPKLQESTIDFMRKNGMKPERMCPSMWQQKDKFTRLKLFGDNIRSCAPQLKEGAAGVVSVETLRSYSILTEDRLTDEDILKWLCGYGKHSRLPRLFDGSFQRAIVDGKYSTYLCSQVVNEEVPEIPDVILSCSFLQVEELEKESGTPSHPYFKNLLARFKNEIMATDYPRLPEHLKRLPHPDDFWRMPYQTRWQMYRYWRDTLLAELDLKFRPFLVRVEAALSATADELSAWRMVADQRIMASKEVVGMTTSFAASRQQILKELKPRIVIVEEAAEVFESHVLVSLAGEVEHLIMIGDHQQLRPNPSVHELAVKYHLNVSLFERLINKGLHYVTLSTQHRMRPEVAKLISPAIYPHLQNHPSVAQFPAVRGVASNVFFLDHKQPEEYFQDAQSFQNSHEAEFLSSLVQYLLLQGYNPAQITVLSAYKGQQHLFSKLKKDQPHLKDVRTTVVDNFQGEENDIILLSLVRSNAEDVVGFLKTENRVCVALSRARHGLYIIGNMANMTAADTVWRKVEAELRRQGAVGPELRLHCDRHGVVTPVCKAEDFASCPQGGCQLLCRTLMPCGHDCKQVCHIQDMEHKTVRCKEKCTRPACALQHPCPQLCFVQPCPPCLVPKEEKLPCGHTARMPCHVDPATYKCKVVVSCKLPACGHERTVLCHERAHLVDLLCRSPCTMRLSCGHACRQKCHALKDPYHEQVKCRQRCARSRQGCTSDPPHHCGAICYQPCEDCTVSVDKTLACGHVHKAKCNADAAQLVCKRECQRTLAACGHKCRKKCHEPCEPCEEKVPKKLPLCGHTQNMGCGTSPELWLCEMPCERLLPCGHPCGLLCRQACSSGRCQQPVPYSGSPACGHSIEVPCHLQNDYEPASPELLALCTHPCGALLKPCDHQCGGSCGACLQGRLHQPCKAKCERPLLCGHLCREACPKVCPPCNRKCEQKCVHSSCGNICGKPCAHCKEPCSRRCEHGACDKRCGDQCSFECNEPCLKKLRGCGHDCIGLCGDPCICKECSEDDVTEIFFGTEEDDGARFVLLPDCKHILESSSLNDWMTIKANDNIKPKLCPKCNTPVTTSQRYSNVIKKIAQDMAVVKAQFYDAKKIQSHLEKIAEIREDVPEIAIGDFREFSVLAVEAVRYVQSVEKKMPKGRETGTRKVAPLNTSEAKNLEQKFLILRSITQIVAKAQEDDKFSGPAMAEVVRAVNHLCSNLRRRDLVRLSEQEAYDISRELERLQRLVELLQAESGPSFRQLDAANRAVHAAISKAVRGLLPYTEELDRRVRDQLSKLAQACSVTITRQELDAIVAAMDMLPGHWFRCPNGHLYCITECGGAVEEARCPIEGCGARIGGGSHQLRSDNTVATDIDGATMSAYDNAMRLYR